MTTTTETMKIVKTKEAIDYYGDFGRKHHAAGHYDLIDDADNVIAEIRKSSGTKRGEKTEWLVRHIPSGFCSYRKSLTDAKARAFDMHDKFIAGVLK